MCSREPIFQTDAPRRDVLALPAASIWRMRERATMLGGHLTAEPTGDDEFLVTAVLPLGDNHPEGS